ncbi:MAG: protein translocase subunit SecD [Rickettsia sp.]|nr:protein translocase subunit SecD [Rickettsia sp.]
MKIAFFSISLTLFSLFISSANIFELKWIKKIPLGLDLRGGNEILLQLDIEDYIEDQYQSLAHHIRTEIKDLKKHIIKITPTKSFIVIKLTSKKDLNFQNQFERYFPELKNYLDMHFDEVKKSLILSYNKNHLEKLTKQLFQQSIDVIRKRIDSSGLNEISIQKKSSDQLLIQVPGLQTSSDLKILLSKVAKLSLHIVNDSILIDEFDPMVNRDLKLSHSIEKNSPSIIISKMPIFTGENIKTATVEYNEYGIPVVSFALNSFGSKIFSQVTTDNIGKRIAILLDGKYITAPVINQPIIGGRGVISSKNFSFADATQLVSLIRSGSLPVKLNILEEKIIGPSLGSDYIMKGKYAVCIAVIVVIFIMIMFYSILGVLSSISLLLTINYIISLITLFNMTLSFASIAGIVLTIGMAVDANVLIYEKIKEELILKKSIIYSVHKGFQSAFVSIWDSNMTTLFAMFFLYILGKGPLQSFAMSLSIGIIASMFSALVVNRYLIHLTVKYLSRFKFLKKFRLA